MSENQRPPLEVEHVGAVHCGLFRGRVLIAKATRDMRPSLQKIADEANGYESVIVILRKLVPLAESLADATSVRRGERDTIRNARLLLDFMEEA